MSRPARLLVAVPVAALVAGVLGTTAAAATPSATPSTAAPRPVPALRTASAPDVVTRLIVRTASGSTVGPALRGAVAAAADVAAADTVRRLAGGSTLVTLSEPLSTADAWAAARELATRPDVISAEPDIRLFPADASPVTPDDPDFVKQWDLWDSARTKGGFSARVPGAWTRTTGTGQVVAVVDTGITDHPDLDANVVSGSGYDFVSAGADDPAALVANDGDGRDDNPTDPGDWITAAERDGSAAGGFFRDCPVADSSWHGTHVAGTIAAVRDTAGIVGVAPSATILPVRALGKCGGWLSDIADAIRWSAGGSVSGAPANPTPASVINLSLGGDGACSAYMQSAITAATGLGATVVVAAGNSGRSITASSASDGSTPANCAGVIAVAATTRAGAKASYSNFGTVGGTVALSAPGGDQADPIRSTVNLGTTVATGPGYAGYQGTSMAAPHVAAAAALVRAYSPSPLSPAQVQARLQAFAQPFPSTSGCTAVACGTGILDVAAAVDGIVQSAALTTGGVLYPFADGYLDTVTVRTTSEISVPGLVRILNSSGSLARQWTLPSATRASVTWNGTTASGRRVADGTYRAQVLLADRDGVQRQVALLPISVRRSQAATPTISLSTASVYPVRDGFQDSVRITTKAGPPTTFAWRVVRDGRVVWSKNFTRRTAAAWSWRAVDRDGRRLAPGRYTLRVTARGGEGTAVTRSRTVTVSGKRAVAERFTLNPSPATVARYGGGNPKDPYVVNDYAFFPADSVITFTRRLPSSVKPHSGVRITACGRRSGDLRPSPVLGFFSGKAFDPVFYPVARELPAGSASDCATTTSGPPVAAKDGGTLRWYIANMRLSGSTWRLDSLRITGTRYVLR